MPYDVSSVVIPVKLGKPNPFVGPSVENDQPISYPLDSIDKFFQWKANDPNDHGQLFSVARTPHTPKVTKEGSLKTLVCDDNSNGYQIDRFVQGQSNQNTYYTQYWNMIDIFVYFSHHFVTVPPVSWINAAHRNGVTMLGTFITEGDAGYQKCKLLLSSEKIWKRAANQLVGIARFYGFDGWFLNIENPVNEKSVSVLLNFIRYLTEKMHEVDSNGLVIWYDAVTCDGTLDYQNELNDRNKCFYNDCDGIFLNYAWNEKNLEVSHTQARSGSSVFVGVDVFGRYSSSAGGFQTDIAMNKIQRSGLSSGIFAPVWDYATFGIKNFQENDKKFWMLLQPYCSSYPLDFSSISSRFNPGDNPDAWSYVNAQDLMPLLPSPYLSVKADDTARIGKLIVGIPENFSKNDDLIPLFKFQMSIKQGQTVSLFFPDNCNCEFVLQSNTGVIKPTFTTKRQLPFLQTVNEAIYESKSAVEVHGLAIKIREEDEGNNFTISFLRCFPSLSHDFPQILSPACKCIDVYWQKRDDRSLYFSATLVFVDLPDIVASSNVQCEVCSGEKHTVQNVGSSFSDRFRIHNLVVVNPHTHFSESSLLFTVSHLSSSGLKLAESHLKITCQWPTSSSCCKCALL